MAEPAAKKQKIEEAEAKDEEMKGEEETKPATEPLKELEEDAPADKKPKVQDAVSFAVADTTLNVMASTANNVLMCMQEGGMQHLLAGARANTGIKSGRYSFEVKTLEQLTPAGTVPGPKPKHMVKVGFATADAGLLLGGEGTTGFDSEGCFFDAGKKNKAGVTGAKFGRDSVVSVVLNLDASSPNANTISLFVNGKRASEPKALPESLKGKVLFPAVTFRNTTIHTNFGASPLCALPFKCRMVQDAAKADTVAAKPSASDGKTLALPVGLPEEGPFDWVDGFMAANPDYVELSDRMIIGWAEKSGIYRKASNKGSADKPAFDFGLREMDDGSIRRAIMSMAPLQQRNYLLVELKDNLIKESRAATLSRFGDDFKKVAHVVMGEPTPAFKKKTQEATLAAKQAASDAAFNAKKAEEKRKKLLEKKTKEAERARKKADKVKAKKIKEQQEAMKKKQAELKAKKEGKEVEAEEEKKEEPEEAEEEEEPIPEVEDDPTPPPKVELDAEEKKLMYRKTATPDMHSYALSTQFTKFSLPSKEEGFGEIKYEWTKEGKCEEYLKQWILSKKLSVKVEDLQPSAWFHQQLKKWEDSNRRWHAKVNEYKAKVAKKIADKQRKEAKEKAAKAAKAAAEAKKAKEAEEAKAKGEEPKEEEKKEEEPAPMEVEEKEEEEVVVDFDGIDIFGADVTDLGGGMPLFKDFAFEDWAMMSLHFELHLLAHAYAKDVNDPERSGILLDHLPFYYNKYFKKPLVPKAFGVDSVKELVEMASDSVKVTDKDTLESLMAEEMENMQVFVQMTEEARRHRKYKLDLGEESFKLKLTPQAHTAPSAAPVGGGGGFAAGGFAKGKGKGGFAKIGAASPTPRFSPYPAGAPRMWAGAKKGAGKGAGK